MTPLSSSLDDLTRRRGSAFACLAEALAPAQLFAGAWALLALECRDRLEREVCPDPVLDYMPEVEHQPAPAISSTAPGRVRLASSTDPLKSDVALRTYFEAEFGTVVPPHGRVRCPSPDHEDRNPSAQIRNGAWRCWSCGQYGDVIDLAGLLQGIEPRGEGYWRLREHVVETLERAALRTEGAR